MIKTQLEYLGYDTEKLKNQLIGLKGKTKSRKTWNLFKEIDIFLSEAARVLKKNKYLSLLLVLTQIKQEE